MPKESEPITITDTISVLASDPQAASLELTVFIGLNPSTADETQDDPTIRRCLGFSKRWGFSALCMTNLFALRATDPRQMKSAFYPPQTPSKRDQIRAKNLLKILEAIISGHVIVSPDLNDGLDWHAPFTWIVRDLDYILSHPHDWYEKRTAGFQTTITPETSAPTPPSPPPSAPAPEPP